MDFSIFIDNFLVIMLLILIFSLLIDAIMGDPHWKYHPVMLIGQTISGLKNKLRTNKPTIDKLLGIIFLITVFLIFLTPIFLFQIIFWWIWNIWDPNNWNNLSLVNILIYCLVMGFILKWSFAIKNLGDSTKTIGESLNQGDLESARSDLSLIVRRDTESLEEPYIISATVECIAESSTDSVISVFWFFLIGNLFGILVFTYIHSNVLWLFLGIPSAYMFRIINTADSIVGYKDSEHINIGWFSARMDDFSNYIPTRLTVLFMLLAGKIMKKDVKEAMHILKSDRKNTESVNAGWTMGTMAGLLNVQLEKKENYKLGVPNRALVPKDIKTAYRIILLTVYLFIFFLSLVIILIVFLIII